MKLIQKFERGKLGNSSFKAESLTISKNCLIFLIPHLKSKQVSPTEKNFEDYLKYGMMATLCFHLLLPGQLCNLRSICSKKMHRTFYTRVSRDHGLWWGTHHYNTVRSKFRHGWSRFKRENKQRIYTNERATYYYHLLNQRQVYKNFKYIQR